MAKKTKNKLSILPKVSKTKTKDRDTNFRIRHLSASSMIKFSTNPILFKIEQINGDSFEVTRNASGVLGQAFHTAMDVHYGGSDTLIPTSEAEAIEYGLRAGMDFLETYPDGFIKFSDAMPTKQAIMERFAFVYNSYVRERPYNLEEVLLTEEKMQYPIDIEWRGERLTLPIELKGYMDKVVRRNGKISIVDYKTCHAFSNPEKIDGAKIVQAVVYYLLAFAHFGEEPYSMIYEEVKYSANRDKSDQVRHYEMVFAENEEYFDLFFRLYDDVIRAISGEAVFVPNFNALYDNEVALISYIHRLDVDEETAKLMKKHRVSNITDLLKKKIQSAKNMRTLLKTVEKDFVSAKTLNYATMKNEEKIQTKMLEYGMKIQFDSKISGPSVDLYRYMPSVGIKMSKLGAYIADVEQVLGISGVRVLAPIPGTSLIGYEVPRAERRFPALPTPDGFKLCIGETVDGICFKYDIREAPHMLIAGSSGSGKSVFLGNIIKQLSSHPDVELHLYDPKRVELSFYSGMAKEYIDDKKGIGESLTQMALLMEERYDKMKKAGVRDITGMTGMPYKFIIIDEFAELAMRGIAGNAIQSIAQMGRAAGIHMIIATQRASTKIINGDTKVNFPVKMVFRVAKAVDSTVMLDEAGAEKLLGKGDALFSYDGGTIRLQAYSA